MKKALFSTPVWTVVMLSLLLGLAGCRTDLSRQPAAAGTTSDPSNPVIATRDFLPVSGRSALVSSVVNQVLLFTTAGEAGQPLSGGEVLPLLGDIETGEQSQARLDVIPDGTFIRLGENTRLQLAALTEQEQQTRLQLFFGKIWVVLNGGQLDVETSSGTAAVRGSLLSVAFAPENGALIATCLEGHCALENDQGQVELTGGQAAEITAPNAPPSPPREITPEELQDWSAAVPESAPYLPPEYQPAPPAENGQNPAKPFVVDILNDCPGASSEINPDIWKITLTGNDGSTYIYTLQPGERTTITLPAGLYTITMATPDGEVSKIQVDSAQTPLYADRCGPPGQQPPDNAPPPEGENLTGEETATTYQLVNPCDQPWHWVFSGPATIKVTIPPGETATGTLLPIGTYSAEDHLEGDGNTHYTAPMPPGGDLIATAACP